MFNRHFCWSTDETTKFENVQLQVHQPTPKNLALVCDDIWEGNNNGYACVIDLGDVIRFYYRASAARISNEFIPCICVAESYDRGVTFHKVNVGKYEFAGSKFNNIVFNRGHADLDNFCIFYDKNPNCPEDERFKAIGEDKDENGGFILQYYASKDGLDFRKMYVIGVKGTFDTYNVTFWDEKTQQYFLYYRSFHDVGETDMFAHVKRVDYVNSVRDIRVATSKDFRTWTEHGRIKYKEGQPDIPMYTNQIQKYYRGDDMLIGFPVRYIDRAKDKRNYDLMPQPDLKRKITAESGRGGTVVTDAVIMTSTDGFTFDRRDEGYFVPGIERNDNWWYGECYTAYGMVETPVDHYNKISEISMYYGESYRIKSCNFRRCSIRLDGFYSWYGPLKGGEIVTKPITVAADEMKINFATSAVGHVQITVCDEAGNPIDGYESYLIFGNTTERLVEFEKPISELKGKKVTLKIKLSDAHLYSFVI